MTRKPNVKGARAVGMRAIQFQSVEQFTNDLERVGLSDAAGFSGLSCPRTKLIAEGFTNPDCESSRARFEPRWRGESKSREPYLAGDAFAQGFSFSTSRTAGSWNVQTLDKAIAPRGCEGRMPSRQPAGRRRYGRYADFSSIAWAASMKPMVCAMPACQGAGQVICGVWSGMTTPSNLFFARMARMRSISTSPSSMNVSR